jgi:hypothetical protein
MAVCNKGVEYTPGMYSKKRLDAAELADRYLRE